MNSRSSWRWDFWEFCFRIALAGWKLFVEADDSSLLIEAFCSWKVNQRREKIAMVRDTHVVLFCVITTQNKRGEEMRGFSALLSAARAFPSLTFSSPRERKISSPLVCLAGSTEKILQLFPDRQSGNVFRSKTRLEIFKVTLKFYWKFPIQPRKDIQFIQWVNVQASLCHKLVYLQRKRRNFRWKLDFSIVRLDSPVNTSSDGGKKLYGRREKKFRHHPSLIFLSRLLVIFYDELEAIFGGSRVDKRTQIGLRTGIIPLKA